jgi:hypothetical protein
MPDTDFIAKAYAAFEAAPVVFIAWTIIVAGGVGALAWLVRRSVDAGTIDALRERLELRREVVERITQDLDKAQIEIIGLRKTIVETSPAARAMQFLDSLESHTASATTQVAALSGHLITVAGAEAIYYDSKGVAHASAPTGTWVKKPPDSR